MAWAIQWDGHNANSIIILYEEKKLQASLWALGAYIYMYWICCRKFPQKIHRGLQVLIHTKLCKY